MIRLRPWVGFALGALLLVGLLFSAHVGRSAKKPIVQGTVVYRIGRVCPSSLPLAKWIPAVPLWDRVDFGPGIVGFLGGLSDQQALIWTAGHWRYEEIGFEVVTLVTANGLPWTVSSDGNLPGSGVWLLTLTKHGYMVQAAWVVNGTCRSIAGPTSPEAQAVVAAVIRAASAQPELVEFRAQCHFTAAQLACSAIGLPQPTRGP